MAKNTYLAGFINGALQMTRRLRMSISQKLASRKGSAEDAKAGKDIFLMILAYLSSRSVKICVNPWLIKDLRLRKITYEIINFFCKTKPNSEKSS